MLPPENTDKDCIPLLWPTMQYTAFVSLLHSLRGNSRMTLTKSNNHITVTLTNHLRTSTCEVNLYICKCFNQLMLIGQQTCDHIPHYVTSLQPPAFTLFFSLITRKLNNTYATQLRHNLSPPTGDEINKILLQIVFSMFCCYLNYNSSWCAAWNSWNAA